jgi:prepilin-type N-terminal cleavage/methylation domain-containing protein
MSRLKHGFTLIELLVIIAIIAILAALLFPVLSQSREDSWKTQCLSNTHQIGFAILMYAQDADETIVPWINRTGLPRDTARRDYNTWVHLLQPYVKNGNPPRLDNLPVDYNLEPLDVWKCPSFKPLDFVNSVNSPDCYGPGSVDSSDLARQYYAHYGIISPPPGGPTGSCTQSDPYFNYPGSDPIITFVTGNLAQIQRSAETVIVTDGATFMSNRSNYGIFIAGGCVAATSHQGGGNHTFLDGHAKFLEGNSERDERQDPADGCWYKTYYTIDR